MKLKEASFFFENLKETYRQIPEFDYNLSAFISAGRSVLFVMRTEYSKVEGWEDWFQSTDWPADVDHLIPGLTDARNRTQKRETLNTVHQVKLEGLEFLPDEVEGFEALMERVKDEAIPMRLTLVEDGFLWEVEIDGELHQRKGTTATASRELKEFPGEEILEICGRYLQALNDIVNECSQRFETP